MSTEQLQTVGVECSKDEFFRDMANRNVTPVPVGNWPYTSLYKSPDGRLFGKSVHYLPPGSALTQTRYFLHFGERA